MIYLSPKGTLFYYDGEFGWTDENNAKRITEEQIEQCTLVSKLPLQYLRFFQRVDIQEFLDIKNSPEIDIRILEDITKGQVSDFFERYAIISVDG